MGKLISKPDTLHRKHTKLPVLLSDLRDGDKFFLKDHYDSDFVTDDYKWKNPDLAHTLGSFKLHSESNLEFIKRGNKLLPYGYVNHTIEDTYDFNRGTRDFLLYSPLENAGKAKSFKIKSTWKTQPTGVIKLGSDKLDTSGIEWILLP